MQSFRRPLVWVGIVGVFAGGAGVAYATQAATSQSTSVINACVKKNGQVTLVGAPADCGQNEAAVSWNVQGVAGAAGPTGATGPVGANGATGATGAAGPTGATGPAGATGSEGPTGPRGLPGAPGAPGADGTNGTNGTNGVDGTRGIDGKDGVSVVSTALLVGDVNCPNGGSRLVAGAVTSYACNGTNGSGAGFNGSFTSPNGKYKLRITNEGIVLAGPPGSVTIDRTLIRVNEGPWNGLFR